VRVPFFFGENRPGHRRPAGPVIVEQHFFKKNRTKRYRFDFFCYFCAVIDEFYPHKEVSAIKKEAARRLYSKNDTFRPRWAGIKNKKRR
jgi:hypothetical protein